MDYALIEYMLVGTGADLKAADENIDTAVVLATMNPSEDWNPPKDFLSPTLPKVINY